MSTLVPLMDQFPEMRELITSRGTESWDFFGTVAAVGAGMFLAYQRDIPQGEVLATEKTVAKVLNKWDRRGYEAYSDFPVQFLARNTEGGMKAEPAAGAWVMWNIKGSEPTKREFEVGQVIGAMFFEIMAGAWPG